MSEYAEIKIDKFSLQWFRNYLNGEIVSLFFSKDDLETYEVCNEEETYTGYTYKTTVKKAKERLDALGYSPEKFEKQFDEKIIEAIDCFDYLYQRGIDYDDEEEYIRKNLLKHLSFRKWKNSLHKLISYELKNGNLMFQCRDEYRKRLSTVCDKILFYSIDDDGSCDSLYGIDTEIIEPEYVYRMILDNCDDEAEIELDFTNIQWWNDDCIPKALEAAEQTEKIVVLVEGSSDKDILEFALNRLYPHLSDMFYFMDFDDSNGGKRDGGTSFVIKNLKAFYFSHLKAKFIAIFDNDAEGYSSKCTLLNEIKHWPDNFRIMLYPELKQFKSYPTIIPNGSIMNDNINKKAASIELYLPERIIKKDSSYLPIEWESRKKIRGLDGKEELLYQGVITEKDSIKAKFHELKRRIESGKEEFNPEEWAKLDELIKTIIFAFCLE